MIIYNSHNLSFIIKGITHAIVVVVVVVVVVIVVVIVVVPATPLLFSAFLKIHYISFLVLVFS